MLRWWAVYLLLALGGCAVALDDAVPPPPARTINITLDLQPVVVAGDWDMSALDELTTQLNSAFAQAGVGFRILPPQHISRPEWEAIDNETVLQEMMRSHSPGITVWLVRRLGPDCICPADGSEAHGEYGGVAYPPTHFCHGVTLAAKAGEDRNTLVHEMGHALGLDHPAEGVLACDIPEVACRFMSYCYRDRNQFSPAEIETIRLWGAQLQGN